ncbi:MAG: hypothetical protein WC986_14515 [Elusimicrobiota bacterium]|jgi:hypothetical protein
MSLFTLHRGRASPTTRDNVQARLVTFGPMSQAFILPDEEWTECPRCGQTKGEHDAGCDGGNRDEQLLAWLILESEKCELGALLGEMRRRSKERS